MASIVDVLAKVASVPSEESKKILAEVRANLKQLDDCAGPHEFSPVPDGARTIFLKHRCAKCGGTIDAIHASWYARGLEHGRKQGEETK